MGNIIPTDGNTPYLSNCPAGPYGTNYNRDVDDYLREAKESVVKTLDAEHDLTNGGHKFGSGTTAARVLNASKFRYNTDRKCWEHVDSSGSTYSQCMGLITSGTGTGAGQDPTLDKVGQMRINSTSGALEQIQVVNSVQTWVLAPLIGVFTTEPTNGVKGSAYYNSAQGLLYIHNGTSFVPVGGGSLLYSINNEAYTEGEPAITWHSYGEMSRLSLSGIDPSASSYIKDLGVWNSDNPNVDVTMEFSVRPSLAAASLVGCVADIKIYGSNNGTNYTDITSSVVGSKTSRLATMYSLNLTYTGTYYRYMSFICNDDAVGDQDRVYVIAERIKAVAV